jgi:hypothetical protein
VGFFSKFFSKRASANESQPTKGLETVALVNAYGAVLTEQAESGSAVSDVSKLPAPKDTMRAVIIAAIQATLDAKLRDQLEGAYVMLGTFQKGVGSKVIKVETDLSPTPDLNGIQAIAGRVVQQSKEFMHWNSLVISEQRKLLEDLEVLRAARKQISV